MDGSLDSGLLAINLSDSEDSSEASKPKQAQTRAEKTAQSEAGFQAVKASYRPKVENGEVGRQAGRQACAVADVYRERGGKGGGDELCTENGC